MVGVGLRTEVAIDGVDEVALLTGVPAQAFAAAATHRQADVVEDDPYHPKDQG